ncbi:TRAP transporter substrate-binding protein [Methylobrevis albus]|uniref:TRAP transporter substrate-binding protein n=1 Tax=Methylobrevis albus TaxID=2793297 RepID=A0A931I057_9HYPH|nr:TRAP transporter substrate-binding protein [Methylobrevis albus]MBH0237690.1 TRAP transporter substrate-binding protein [Methylobrevis albus]
MSIITKLMGALALSTSLIAGSAFAADIVLRSADIHPDGYPTVEAVKYVGELVKERTGGRIEIQVFHSAQLGEEKDTIEQTQFGVIDMNRINMAPLNNLVPETSIPALPFIFKSIDHMHKVVDGEIGDEILAALESQGLIGLAFYDSGARSFYTVNKPVRSIDDLKGMKIRVQQSDMWLATIEALGANATPMAFGEVYSALQTGVIDGAENNWPSLESSKHYEVAKFYTLSEHSMSPEVFAISKISWDKLTPEDQAILKQAAKESVAKMRELWTAREKQSEETVRAAGVEVITLDKAPFAAVMQPVYDRFASTPELKDLVARIQAIE